MKGQLIKGKPIADAILEKTKIRVDALKEKGILPKLAVLLVGDDAPSQTYVQKKGVAAKEIGMDFYLHTMPEASTTEEVIAAVATIQHDSSIHGLIIQLPLPKHIDRKAVLDTVIPEKDVDCLSETNYLAIESGEYTFLPPTPHAVISAIKSTGIDSLKGKKINIIGRGILVGKPLAHMMRHEGADVTTCNSKTTDVKEKCLAADIVVTGVGKKNLLTKDMISEGAIIADAGISFEGQTMYGDVDVKGCLEKASYVTPTPNGTGPITVAHLLENTVIAAERQNSSLQD